MQFVQFVPVAGTGKCAQPVAPTGGGDLADRLSPGRVEQPVFGDLEMPFDYLWWGELESEVQLVQHAVCPVSPPDVWRQSLLEDLVKACCGSYLRRFGSGRVETPFQLKQGLDQG